jgi:hypothetical protein
MTTSFAWFTRGRLDRAWQANPGGFLAALVTVPVASWLLVCCWYKKPIGFRSIDRPLMGLLLSIVAASLAFWLIRFFGASGNLSLTGFPLVGGLN